MNEPHAALGQPAGQQAVVGEGAVGAFAAVHIEHVLRLVGDVDQVGHARLHAERQFVLRDARGDFGILLDRIAHAIQTVDGRDDVVLLRRD